MRASDDHKHAAHRRAAGLLASGLAHTTQIIIGWCARSGLKAIIWRLCSRGMMSLVAPRNALHLVVEVVQTLERIVHRLDVVVGHHQTRLELTVHRRDVLLGHHRRVRCVVCVRWAWR